MKTFYSIFIILLLSLALSGYGQTAQEYFDRGLSKSNNKDYSGAITDYNKAIQINPKHAKAYLNRGILKFMLQEDYTGGKADINKSIEIDPNNSLAYYMRGNMKYALKDYSGAIADLDIAEECNNENDAIFYLRGEAKRESKDYNGAIADYSKYIEVKPKYAEAYFKRGLAKANSGQKESGCQDFNTSVELGYTKADEAIKNYCANIQDKQQFGSEKVSYNEFSNRIKTKYPEYKDVDNLVLAKKVVAKYPEYKDKVLFDQQDNESIYSFLKKNNLTTKSEKEFYTTYENTVKAKELYDFFVENKLTEKDFKTFYKDNLSKDRMSFDQSTQSQVRRYKVGKKIYSIPLSEVKVFLDDMPDAREIQSFSLEKDTFDIPIDKVSAFLKDMPDAKPLLDYHYKNPEPKLKQLYNDLAAKNPEIKDNGFQAFANDMKDESKFRQVYDGLSKKYPEWKTMDYESFKKEMFPEDSKKTNNEEHQFKGNEIDKTDVSNSSFQIDKIKVGETSIDLPIPSGFVKVDDTMNPLLDLAKKLCPETNTLLAYYISEEDYGNYLINQNHIIEKYIFVQIYNNLKGRSLSNKEYGKFIGSFKKGYIDEYKQILDNAGDELSEKINEINESLKLNDADIKPLGICYESRNSISYGALSKFNFSLDGEGSREHIVTSISTITKIQSTPIFLLTYCMYKSNEDIISLKAMNLAWVKEIDKKQSPTSFIADIDFKDYKEALLAILTLSFIWAIYFATKKIHGKLKIKNAEAKNEIEGKIELYDFDELLIEAKVSIEPEPILVEPQKIKEKVQMINLHLSKVSRQLRLFHFLVDIAFIYLVGFSTGFALSFLIGQDKVLEHQYFIGFIVLFATFFIQESIFGKTIGKFITKTHVVNSHGGKPTIWQLVLRNASRVIPFEPFTFVLKNSRGFHDSISNTFVIKD